MKKAAVAILIAILGAAMIAAVLHLPAPGDPDAPAHTHVSAFYVEGGHEAAGADNLVTAVLLNYRNLDTFGEVVIIFTALLAVLAVASVATTSERDDRPSSAGKRETIPVSPVVAFIVRLIAPFIAVFALFVMIKGHLLPGGGFQGGVVLGAMLILLSVFARGTAGVGPIRGKPLFALRGAGVLVFGLVAVIGIVVSGWVLGLSANPVTREALMIGLEMGIGIGGAAVLIGLFHALEEQ